MRNMAPDEEPEEDEEEEEPADLEEAETELAEEEVESSWEELLAKRAETMEDDEESIFDLGRDDTVESLSVRPTPPQPTEFICSNCRLVKYKSQLADKKRNLCSDCV